MFTKLFLVALLGFALTGCAARFQKPISEPPEPVAYEAQQQTAQSQSYSAEEQPMQKAVSAPIGKLSAKQIQTALKNAGYYTGAIDGKIGRKTRAAIKKFQAANGLKADGVVGKKTSEALKAHLTQ